jgi:hypothetical protein
MNTLKTFSITVPDGEDQKKKITYMTGAVHQGDAASALAAFLKIDVKDVNILKISQKDSFIFVPPLNHYVEAPYFTPEELKEGKMPEMTPEELKEGMKPDEDPDKALGF